MSVITIQCRLVADDETLRHLWELMAEKNTPFVNEILERLGKHDDFQTWIENSRVPKAVIKELCNSLRNQEPFAGQSGRFYTSATTLVTYIYKSWLALNKQLQRKIEGRERWLDMLKSDAELEQESNSNLDNIRAKANEILASFAAQQTNELNRKPKTPKNKKLQQEKAVQSPNIKSSVLFEGYHQSEDALTRCALVHLLKNNCQVNHLEEDTGEYAKQRRKKEIEIERLKDQLKNRVPKGRDLTGEKWFEVLKQAVSSVPKDEDEAKYWQARLLKKSSYVPFPIVYETNEDIKWEINEKCRIFVRFNGLGKLKFEVYCDKRHLHLFHRFIEDQEIKHQGKNHHSSSLFTLRSGRISWLEQAGKGKPWNINRLLLFCSVDTRMLTAEGTQKVIAEKTARVENDLARTKEKEEKGKLNAEQQAHVTRKQTTLARINTPFTRPSKPLYEGQSHMLVSVSLGLEKPATIAVFDAANNKVITYLSTKQLLGDNYNLLNRKQQQKQRLSHERHKSQKQFAHNAFGESELGQYLDRLLAKKIVSVAKSYFAGSIVLPKLGDMREIIQSEVQAKAEKKMPGFIEGQKNYAKEYRKSAHNWSYGRLIENIQSQAAKEGIAIETGQQPTKGIPQEQARDLALFAYQCRIA